MRCCRRRVSGPTQPGTVGRGGTLRARKERIRWEAPGWGPPRIHCRGSSGGALDLPVHGAPVPSLEPITLRSNRPSAAAVRLDINVPLPRQRAPYPRDTIFSRSEPQVRPSERRVGALSGTLSCFAVTRQKYSCTDTCRWRDSPRRSPSEWGDRDNGDGAQLGVSLAHARALVAPPSLCIFHTAIFRRRMVLARVQDWASSAVELQRQLPTVPPFEKITVPLSLRVRRRRTTFDHGTVHSARGRRFCDSRSAGLL